MTGRELHEALRAGGVFEVGSATIGPEHYKVGLAEPYNALTGKQRDALDRAAALIQSYPSHVESPVDPPTVEGTSITRDVGR